MWTPYSAMRSRFTLVLAVLYFPALVLAVEPTKNHRPFNNTIPAMFVFGDSTVDPGNNNYYTTLFKSNFKPYGMNFPGHVPTGRFTDGRLVTDFIASYVGIKENVPPCMDEKLELKDLMTGVSFASAGAGYDEVTSILFGVVPVLKQVDLFRQYKVKIGGKIGKKKAEKLIKNAAYIVSAGTNDIVLSYYLFNPLQRFYDIDTYLNMLIGNARRFLEDLKKEGARNIAIVGLSKIGCIPAIVTIIPGEGPINQRNCNESLSLVAQKFNEKLIKLADSMNGRHFKVLFADIYKPFEKMVHNPSKYGFEKVTIGCCGSGIFEMTLLCNEVSRLCKNPSKHIFFDAVHPSEAAYKQMFKALRPTIDTAIKTFQ